MRVLVDIPVRETLIVVLLSGVSWSKVMVPLMPLWLKVAVTVRAAEDGRSRRMNTCKTRTTEKSLLSFLDNIVTWRGQLQDMKISKTSGCVKHMCDRVQIV